MLRLALQLALLLALAAAPAVVLARTVGQVLDAKGCSTGAIRALSRQLLDEINCEKEGLFVSFAGEPGFDTSGGGVFPVAQKVLVDKLRQAQRRRGVTMKFTSVIRTYAQQW
jgi:hypothetical protein